MVSMQKLQEVSERLAELQNGWNTDELQEELQAELQRIQGIIASMAAQPVPNTKRTRGKRRPATPLVANGSQAAHLRADIFQQAIMSILRCPDDYEYYPDIGIAETKRKMGTRKKGQLISTIHPLEGEGESSVFESIYLKIDNASS